MGTRLGRLTSGARARNKYTTAATYLRPHAYNISTGGHDNIILYIYPHNRHTRTHTPTHASTHTHTPGESDHGIFSLKNVTSHDPAINHVCFIYCYCYYYYYYYMRYSVRTVKCARAPHIMWFVTTMLLRVLYSNNIIMRVTYASRYDRHAPSPPTIVIFCTVGGPGSGSWCKPWLWYPRCRDDDEHSGFPQRYRFYDKNKVLFDWMERFKNISLHEILVAVMSVFLFDNRVQKHGIVENYHHWQRQQFDGNKCQHSFPSIAGLFIRAYNHFKSLKRTTRF